MWNNVKLDKVFLSCPLVKFFIREEIKETMVVCSVVQKRQKQVEKKLQCGGSRRSETRERNAGQRQILTKADIPGDMQCSPFKKCAYASVCSPCACVHLCLSVCGFCCCRHDWKTGNFIKLICHERVARIGQEQAYMHHTQTYTHANRHTHLQFTCFRYSKWTLSYCIQMSKSGIT